MGEIRVPSVRLGKGVQERHESWSYALIVVVILVTFSNVGVMVSRVAEVMVTSFDS